MINTSLLFACNRRKNFWLCSPISKEGVRHPSPDGDMMELENEEEPQEILDEGLVSVLYSEDTGHVNNPSSYLYRKLDSSEQSHAAMPRMHTLPMFRKDELAVTPTILQFRFNLDVFSSGVLWGIDWSGVMLGGSSVMACLQPIPAKLTSYLELWTSFEEAVYQLPIPALPQEKILGYLQNDQRKRYLTAHLKEYYHGERSPFQSSDLDLFLLASSKEEGEQKIRRLVERIRANIQSRRISFELQMQLRLFLSDPIAMSS